MCVELGRVPVLLLGGANPPLTSINDLQCRAKESRASKNSDGGRAAALAEREV